VIAIAIDNQFWIWTQYPEENIGIGFGNDLSHDQRFVFNARTSNFLKFRGEFIMVL
jgi:hypothetical protein